MDELLDSVTSAELVEWMAYDTILTEEHAKAARLAKKGMNPSRPRRRR